MTVVPIALHAEQLQEYYTRVVTLTRKIDNVVKGGEPVSCNEAKCTCPKTNCENHGKCCACVIHHRDGLNNLPRCLREDPNN